MSRRRRQGRWRGCRGTYATSRRSEPNCATASFSRWRRCLSDRQWRKRDAGLQIDPQRNRNLGCAQFYSLAGEAVIGDLRDKVGRNPFTVPSSPFTVLRPHEKRSGHFPVAAQGLDLDGGEPLHCLALNAQENRFSALAMDIDLGVVDHAGRAVFVDDMVAVHQVTPAAETASGEVAANVVDTPSGYIEASQLFERSGGVLDEIHRVVAGFAVGLGIVHCDPEIAKQNLSWQRPIDHACKIDGYLANDVAESGRVQAFDLMKLIVFADVKSRT